MAMQCAHNVPTTRVRGVQRNMSMVAIIDIVYKC